MAGPDKKRILLVEDHDGMAHVYIGIMRQLGYAVARAPDMEMAIEEFERTPYDLVITDIFMEGMGGVAGISQIRARNAEIPIIAMSAGFEGAMTSKDALEAARKIGANAIVPKPISVESLAAAIAQALG